jgi:hypothetical protein
MWIENFRQFLNRSLQRIGDWARGLDFLPACLVRRGPVSLQESLPAQRAIDALPTDWYVDISYRFRSLQCHMRVSILEPTRGVKFIYRALQGQDEA